MDIMDSMPNEKYIFGGVLVVSNQMDTLLERELKEHNLTTKQWLLTIIVQNSFDHSPTIKEVAKAMGSSHQNVKQVALKLEQKGFLVLAKDEKDGRITRIKLTDQINTFAQESGLKAERFTAKLFQGIAADELSGARSMLSKMLFNLAEMDHEIK